mmetsp:Transcript_19434/g.73437  ORF Transcript_19434/g.73437 Transcript_19434/m.73437 type:complete len:222 (+) Transcript_19434:633-1298(+)
MPRRNSFSGSPMLWSILCSNIFLTYSRLFSSVTALFRPSGTSSSSMIVPVLGLVSVTVKSKLRYSTPSLSRIHFRLSKALLSLNSRSLKLSGSPRMCLYRGRMKWMSMFTSSRMALPRNRPANRKASSWKGSSLSSALPFETTFASSLSFRAAKRFSWYVMLSVEEYAKSIESFAISLAQASKKSRSTPPTSTPSSPAKAMRMSLRNSSFSSTRKASLAVV